MSVVVGVVTDTEVVIAADTALTGRVQTFGETKLVRVGDAAVGWVGSPRWGAFVRGWTEPLRDRLSVEAFATAFLAFVKDHGFSEENSDGSFLIGTVDGLWEVTGLGGVCDGSPYSAIGSGDAIALGALYVGDAVLNSLKGEAEIRKYSIVGVVMAAVEAAIHHHPACGGEVEWERVQREKA